MQQQPENAFCNFSDTLNSINNNKFNNGHDENNFMEEEQMESPQVEEPTVAVVSNDDNNNSNGNFDGPDMGPETDVDAIDEEFQLNAAIGGDKEKMQMEFKETEDVADQAEAVIVQGGQMFETFENKIFDQLSLQNPDMIMGSNPFAPEEDVGIIADVVTAIDNFMDNKMIEQQVDDFTEKMENFESEQKNDFAADDELATSANEEIVMQQQQPQAGESLLVINGGFCALFGIDNRGSGKRNLRNYSDKVY